MPKGLLKSADRVWDGPFHLVFHVIHKNTVVCSPTTEFRGGSLGIYTDLVQSSSLPHPLYHKPQKEHVKLHYLMIAIEPKGNNQEFS